MYAVDRPRCESDFLRLGREIELHDADLLQTGHRAILSPAFNEIA